MSESKKEMIQKMLEMQRKFIDYEHEHGITGWDYWAAGEDHPLHGFRDQYRDLAMAVVEAAHKEVGSHP